MIQDLVQEKAGVDLLGEPGQQADLLEALVQAPAQIPQETCESSHLVASGDASVDLEASLPKALCQAAQLEDPGIAQVETSVFNRKVSRSAPGCI